MVKRTTIVFLFFLSSFTTAHWLALRSWNGSVYVYTGEFRAPAAVRTVRDYSAIDRRALYQSVHEQLLNSAEVLKQDGNVGIRLGHPIVKNGAGGGLEFACTVSGRAGVFDRVELIFYGAGITEGGEPAHMMIDQPCLAGGQLGTLDTVWIPMNQIVSSAPRDQNFVSEETSTQIRLTGIPNLWPEKWVLWSVRFYNMDDPQNGLLVDAGRLKSVRPTMFSFDWKRSN